MLQPSRDHNVVWLIRVKRNPIDMSWNEMTGAYLDAWHLCPREAGLSDPGVSLLNLPQSSDLWYT